jgi:hypothetical protein
MWKVLILWLDMILGYSQMVLPRFDMGVVLHVDATHKKGHELQFV